MDPVQIIARLRSGMLVTDAAFDRHLRCPARHASGRHWTPVGVAARVANWLSGCGVSRVLDVGSGPGKFCVVGAVCSNISFSGVEQRGDLVEAGRELAGYFDVSNRIQLLHGDVDSADFDAFDALYFYNPFGENLLPWLDRVDDAVEFGHRRFHRDVEKVEARLDSMAVGSFMVTYNGFGGRVPGSYDLVVAKMAGRNMLRLWRKTRPRHAGGHWFELEDRTLRNARW